MVSRFFKLEHRGTTPFREFQAGLTTFAAMAYILAVNPEILAHTGMDKAALVTVTAITAAVATTLMALFTNYPIAHGARDGDQRLLHLHDLPGAA
jgi:AGZA family xanthine/uracil permease-like MFS transporter